VAEAAGHAAAGPSPRIRLYIFDMGGVVSDIGGYMRRMTEHLAMSPQRIYRLTEADFLLLTSGRISEAEFWSRFTRATGRPAEADLFTRYFQPENNRRVEELARSLKRVARVVIGTNTIESHYRIHLDRGDYAAFDAVYASHRMGLSKPDPQFFRYILREEACPPGEAVFVDDLEANVAAAGRLGIHALLFTGADTLAGQIAGLQAPAP
jgi:putative hydrolase of the HAD superfamily